MKKIRDIVLYGVIMASFVYLVGILFGLITVPGAVL